MQEIAEEVYALALCFLSLPLLKLFALSATDLGRGI